MLLSTRWGADLTLEALKGYLKDNEASPSSVAALAAVLSARGAFIGSLVGTAFFFAHKAQSLLLPAFAHVRMAQASSSKEGKGEKDAEATTIPADVLGRLDEMARTHLGSSPKPSQGYDE